MPRTAMTRRGTAVWAGAAISALTLSGCASTAPAVPARAATGSGDCTLKADLGKLPGAAAGTSYWDLVVANTGTTSCTLPAQPGLAVLGPAHEQLPVTVNTDPTAEPFVLAAGATAAQVVGYGSDGNPPCDSETAYLRLTPPGTDLAFRAGAEHCAADVLTSSRWVAGNYAAPR
ncbi:MAG: DUF4232 domain-containing protein [Catenulispora sp.]|nr:DUF4232 domain-containing protein [Catenulispora sp.]